MQIAPIGILLGDYTLSLQSFDQNGGVESTLRSDSIKVTVVAKNDPCSISDEVK